MQLELFEVEAKEEKSEVRQKKCIGCGEVHPETDEYFYKAYAYESRDGSKNQFYMGKCKKCHNKAMITVVQLKKKYGHRAYGNCDCCGIPHTETPRGMLYLDHDHTTGEYRGHLCDNCNRGIGLLGDEIDGVLQAVEYLKKVTNSEED